MCDKVKTKEQSDYEKAVEILEKALWLYLTSSRNIMLADKPKEDDLMKSMSKHIISDKRRLAHTLHAELLL